jgi:hypothetical protein
LNVLFAPDVVLDALFDREPRAEAAVALFDRVESGDLVGHLGATTVTTSRAATWILEQREGCCGTCSGSSRSHPSGGPCWSTRLLQGVEDFEDAVLHEAGRLVGAEAITTRDPAGFRTATLRVYDLDTLVAALDAAEGP